MGGAQDPIQRKRHNAFGEFVDKPLAADHHLHGQTQKKHKTNSEAPLSTLDHPFPAFPFSKQLISTFQENPSGSVQFQLFVSRSYSPPPTSTSPPPVYILKVTSGSSNSNGEVETAGNRVDGGATPVVTETRLMAEGQFLLRSRL